MAKFTAEEIQKKRNEYCDNPHHFGALMYLFMAIWEIVKRIDDIERGIVSREHPNYGKY